MYENFFITIETGRADLVRYKYMLEGYDNNWSELSNATTTHFGNIHEGKYTFRVKALGADKIWSSEVQYSFEVLPPWYRSL